MKLQSVVATLALAATVCVPGAMYAAPAAAFHAAAPSFMHATFAKTHAVNMKLRNDGKETLTVKAGDKELTLKPGEWTAVKLMDGDKVIAETASPDHAAGDVMVVASSNLNDATVGIK